MPEVGGIQAVTMRGTGAPPAGFRAEVISPANSMSREPLPRIGQVLFAQLAEGGELALGLFLEAREGWQADVDLGMLGPPTN